MTEEKKSYMKYTCISFVQVRDPVEMYISRYLYARRPVVIQVDKVIRQKNKNKYEIIDVTFFLNHHSFLAVETVEGVCSEARRKVGRLRKG